MSSIDTMCCLKVWSEADGGFFSFFSNGGDKASCSITTGPTVDTSNQIAVADNGNGVEHMPFAGTRGFQVGAGTTFFRLVCLETEGNVRIRDTQMTLIFAPSRY